MADEVINQLAGVAAQIRTARENQPDNFQDLLDEWKETFPQSSTFHGSPKSIAAILEKQSIELDELRNKLCAELRNREEEISQIMVSVNKQLNASCRSVMTERHQASLTQMQQDAKHDELIAAAKAEYDLAKCSLSAGYDASLMKILSKNADLKHQANKTNTALEAVISARQLAHVNELESVKKMHQIERDEFANQISQLEKKLQARKNSISAIREKDNSPVYNPTKGKSNINVEDSLQNVSETDTITQKV